MTGKRCSKHEWVKVDIRPWATLNAKGHVYMRDQVRFRCTRCGKTSFQSVAVATRSGNI